MRDILTEPAERTPARPSAAAAATLIARRGRLVIVGRYRDAQREATAARLGPFQWTHAGRLPQIFGLPRGSRFVVAHASAPATDEHLAVVEHLRTVLDAVEVDPKAEPFPVDSEGVPVTN